jgi:hypothetical protein
MQLAAKHASPWPVKPRLEPAKLLDGTDSPRVHLAGSTAPLVLQGGGSSSSSASVERGGGHTVSRQQGRRAQARVPGGAKIGRCQGCARGLPWLQKSTSGARSSPKGHGSSHLPSSEFKRAMAQGVKTRRKPGRSGDSHEHASSDTGGGLFEIPRKPKRKRGVRPGERALVRWKAPWSGESRHL